MNVSAPIPERGLTQLQARSRARFASSWPGVIFGGGLGAVRTVSRSNKVEHKTRPTIAFPATKRRHQGTGWWCGSGTQEVRPLRLSLEEL